MMHNGYGDEDEITRGDGPGEEAGISTDFADIEDAVRAHDDEEDQVGVYQNQNGEGGGDPGQPVDDGEGYITEEDCWTVISAHFKERTLVNQQLDSFDVFLTNTMQVRHFKCSFSPDFCVCVHCGC